MGNLIKLSTVILLPTLLVAALVSMLDNRVTVSGKDKKIVKTDSFRAQYIVSYTNPIKRIFFKPKYGYKLIKGECKIQQAGNGISVSGKGLFEGIIIDIEVDNSTFRKAVVRDFSEGDSDNDGFPDYYELVTENDKDSFLNWFTSISRSQFYNISESWDPVHQDCAGLISYAYKESLKKHDLNWFKDHKFIDEARDIERFNYPNIPVLGDRCFNSPIGFIASANASSLLNYNMTFISKDMDKLSKGDVLFYYDEKHNMPYHSMVYLKDQESVVYHTGPIDENNNGEVRLLLVDDLLKHPDSKWHPKLKNKYFLGGFRWRILM